MYTVLQAFAHEEGFYDIGSRPYRNNNPGDLEFHPWMSIFGASLEIGAHPRFAKFPTADAGFMAMKHLFGFPLYKGKTLEQVVNIFAPPIENRTNLYLANILKMTGLPATTVIDGVI